jgi:hypothetical protein
MGEFLPRKGLRDLTGNRIEQVIGHKSICPVKHSA